MYIEISFTLQVFNFEIASGFWRVFCPVPYNYHGFHAVPHKQTEITNKGQKMYAELIKALQANSVELSWKGSFIHVDPLNQESSSQLIAGTLIYSSLPPMLISDVSTKKNSEAALSFKPINIQAVQFWDMSFASTKITVFLTSTSNVTRSSQMEISNRKF